MSIEERLAEWSEIIGVGTPEFSPERFLRWDDECPTAMMACWSAALIWPANADAVWDSITGQVDSPEAVCWILEFVRNVGESCRADLAGAARLLVEVGQPNNCGRREEHEMVARRATEARRAIDDASIEIHIITLDNGTEAPWAAKDWG
jgi:hypothetical protein